MPKTVEIVGVAPTNIAMSFDLNVFTITGYEVDAEGTHYKQFTLTTQLTTEQRAQLDAFLKELTDQYLADEGIV